MIGASNFVEVYQAWGDFTAALFNLRCRWIDEQRTWPMEEGAAANRALGVFALAAGLPMPAATFYEEVEAAEAALSLRIKHLSLLGGDGDGVQRGTLVAAYEAARLLQRFLESTKPRANLQPKPRPQSEEAKASICAQLLELLPADADLMSVAEQSRRKIVDCVFGLWRADVVDPNIAPRNT